MCTRADDGTEQQSSRYFAADLAVDRAADGDHDGRNKTVMRTSHRIS